ncbi:MAG: hypothetical protein ACREJ2_17380 [Planctomycetota bacterium]
MSTAASSAPPVPPSAPPPSVPPPALSPAGTAPVAGPPHRGWRVPPMLAVGWITFLEFWRKWFLLGLLVIGLLPGLLATFLPLSTEHATDRAELIVLWGLGGVAFGGALGASVMGSLQTPLEIEDKRIYGLVCRPVGRWRLMLGKMLGCSGFLALYAVIAYGALAAMMAWCLAGKADAKQFEVTRRSQNADMLGFDLDPRHIVATDGRSRSDLNFDFTDQGPIPDWGKSKKERYRWILLTAVRTADGRPDPNFAWPENRPAFDCYINGRKLYQLEYNKENVQRRENGWFLEASGHTILIMPENLAALHPADKVAVTIVPAPGYFHPGDWLFFSDLEVTDHGTPPYDENLKREIPFVQNIVTVGPGQTADYLLCQPGDEPRRPDGQLAVGLFLKSATMFRDMFTFDAELRQFNPDSRAFTVEKSQSLLVRDRKMAWINLSPHQTGGDPVDDQDFGLPADGQPTAGWRVLTLRGDKPVVGQPKSGALFQFESTGDVKFAAQRSTLWCNLGVGIGLFFIQWVCLAAMVVAWSGNLSVGVSILCALILAVACYGSGAARSVLTEQQRMYEYRETMHRNHPEMNITEIAPWREDLNRIMYWIIWAPPDFMQYSPTEKIKLQTDIPFSAWTEAMLRLWIYRALPVVFVGLLVFQRREF